LELGVKNGKIKGTTDEHWLTRIGSMATKSTKNTKNKKPGGRQKIFKHERTCAKKAAEFFKLFPKFKDFIQIKKIMSKIAKIPLPPPLGQRGRKGDLGFGFPSSPV